MTPGFLDSLLDIGQFSANDRLIPGQSVVQGLPFPKVPSKDPRHQGLAGHVERLEQLPHDDVGRVVKWRDGRLTCEVGKRCNTVSDGLVFWEQRAGTATPWE